MLGNVFGPMLGTTLYELSPRAPYLLNAGIMTVVLLAVLAHAAHPQHAELSRIRARRKGEGR